MDWESKAARFARFMSHVITSNDPAECWEWTANRCRGAYGHFSVNGQTVKAHRWIYEAVVGPIPEGLQIRHHCDNPDCVNPAHLEPGTAADNTADKMERGRMPNRQGEKHPLARLTADDVREIRRLSAMGHSAPQIAKVFPITRGQIGKIVRRENWRHV